MTILTTAGESFAKVRRRISPVTVRSGLVYENMFGMNAALSCQSQATGVADSDTIGVPTFGTGWLEAGPASGILTPAVPADDETFILVQELPSTGTNSGLNNNSATNFRMLRTSTTSLQAFIKSGSNASLTISSLWTANLPWFAAATFVRATGAVNLWAGKDGLLTAATPLNGDDNLTLPTAAYRVGNDSAAGTGVQKFWHAMVFDTALAEADIEQIYADLTPLYQPFNADF